MSAALESRSREPGTRVFVGAWSLLALHTIADAFLLPEQGTAWTDHLLPGLAAAAVLAVLLAVYLRGRGGARGALGLALGALALEGFAIAVVDAGSAGARGDDWTGFLLGPAGLALLGLGGRLLWRSRRPGRHRHLRRSALAVLSALGVYVVLVPVGLAILATHRPRQPVGPAALGRAYEQVTVRTSDGLRLAAWYVPSRNGAAIISYPTRSGELGQARMLIRHGYGVLLLDARGYDGSDGAPNMYGWGGAKDIDAAVAWLRRQPDVRARRIGAIGYSVGGEVLLESAAGNPGLQAVVSDGAGIRSLREELLYGARGIPALPAQAVQTAALTLLSGTAPPPSLDALVGKIAPRPVFLIYAEHGAGGEDLSRDYYAAAGRPKQLWRVRGAGHLGGYETAPRAYEHRVIAFFDHSLLGNRPPHPSRRGAEVGTATMPARG